ncbi:AT-rich interactive domain-containing protein 3A-like, partial [Notothenia coriiceps]|uniref:AT-rich interactive domain-containing protein 3 n=1 Tax=Notothenia coriiceps TaxID=8208 RepID=A0A6I9MLM4_9TELE
CSVCPAVGHRSDDGTAWETQQLSHSGKEQSLSVPALPLLLLLILILFLAPRTQKLLPLSFLSLFTSSPDLPGRKSSERHQAVRDTSEKATFTQFEGGFLFITILLGTPVNRIPIMAKQVLDLYMLYKLVTEKGGLVEVINKKIWREITKGLNLPTSITSAAFTLRTQYMKYLYPYECEKRGLSSPGELQAAIDSNRREGRRQSYGSALFNYSPVGTPTLLSSPKMHMSHLSMPMHNSGHISQVPVIKKEEPMMAGYLPGRGGLPMSHSSHHVAVMAAQAQAAAAVQAAALEQLREKLEGGEPPEKKMMIMEEQQRIVQHALQQNLLAMASQLPLNIKLNNRGAL